MGIKVETVTAPAHWAVYLINGDCSHMDDADIAAADAWCERIAPFYVVDVRRDRQGNAYEPSFTWSYDLYSGTARGGDVLDYICHRPTRKYQRKAPKA